MPRPHPFNDNDYSCHITAVELFNQSYEFISRHITPLVINSLGHGHTHTHTNMHTDDPHRINFKKPGVRGPAAGAPGLINPKAFAIPILTVVNAVQSE